MDPNETLKNLRTAMQAIDSALTAKWGAGGTDPFGDDDGLRVAVESLQALDGWLSRGGFLPQDWDRA